MLMSSVQSVALRSAMFCRVCSFVMLVVDAIVNHILEAYSSIVFGMALFVYCFILQD